MPNTTEGVQPYQLFMFCGILPWTWFSSSLAEAANSLIAGGNLIKKVLFPAEVLPLVSVLTNMVHFFLGPPILVAFLVVYGHYPRPENLLWFPVAVLVQLLFTSALAVMLSALAVHFRDVKDILSNALTLWFFATPIIYPWFQPSVQKFHLGPVEAVMTAKSQGHLEQQTADQAMSAGYGRYDDVVQTLRQAVAGRRYLCGDQITAADVLMASYQIGRAHV